MLSKLSPIHIFRIKVAVFILSLWPLARLIWLGLFGGLGANPIEFITRSTGTWTLVFLLITLSVTPFRRWTGWNWLMKLRRMLGLYAFFYAVLHFTTYLWLDQFFDLNEIIKDVMKRPFITIGFASFLIFIPLAATSTNGMMRRLGGQRWQQLHRLIYILSIGGVLHYWWLVKKDISQPLIYGIVLGLLLSIRLFYYLRRKEQVVRLTGQLRRSEVG